MKENQKNSATSSLMKKGMKKITRKMGMALKIKITLGAGVLLIASLFIIGVLMSFQTTSISHVGKNVEIVNGDKPVSEDVLKWQGEVKKYADKYEIPQLTQWALALMQVESGGNLADLMQSSESAGLPVNTLKYEESIEQGLKHLSNAYNIAKSYGIENNLDAIMQSYNFGTAYIHYLGKNNITHNMKVAEEYSKTVVAPSLGNTNGETDYYINEVSIKYGKQYLYKNGGNFYYSELVKQYMGGSGKGVNPSDFYKEMQAEMEKYNGWSYQWGGKNPISGFDCSGLTAYLYQVITGVSIDSYTVSQYNQSVPVSLEEAKAGDLIFFRGTYGAPDFISHVGIYVSETTMFDANSSGIGYHHWQNSYWLSHSPEIRRVIQ